MSLDEITDAELVRYLDGEMTGAARAEIAARLAATPDSAARLETLRRRSARLAQLLVQVDPGELDVRRSARATRPGLNRARTRPAMSTGMKAAAAIALLLGFGLAVPPVRAWMMQQALQVARALGVRPSASTPDRPIVTPEPAPPDPGAALSVTLGVSSDTFTVQLVRPGGQLIVQRVAAPEASLDAPAAASVVALSNAIRIEGGNTAGSGFALRLPTRVTVLRISSGNGATTDYTLPASGQEFRLDLSRQ